MFLKREEKTMAEKKIKQVCRCENCGNEAEMMITCSLEDHKEQPAEPSPVPAKKSKAKGHAVCSHCGNEADMWIDLQ
jgi:ribosomal protein S14